MINPSFISEVNYSGHCVNAKYYNYLATIVYVYRHKPPKLHTGQIQMKVTVSLIYRPLYVCK